MAGKVEQVGPDEGLRQIAKLIKRMRQDSVRSH